MPQQDAAIGLTVSSGTWRSAASAGGNAPKTLLVAMAVHVRASASSGASGSGCARPGTPPAASPARPARRASGAGQQGAELVLQREQAGRLQPDHRHVAGQRRQRASRLGARPLDHAGGEVGAPAAERPARRGGGSRRDSRPPRSTRSAARRFSGSKWRLNVVGSNSTRRAVAGCRARPRASRKPSRAEGGQATRAAAKPSHARPAAQQRQRVAQIGQRRERARRAALCAAAPRPARRAAPRRARSARAASTSIFIFAMSTPVGHSRRHALHETHSSIASATRVRGHGVGAELAGQRQAQRVGAAAREVLSRRAWRGSDGHITPASKPRQVPLLLHISTAPSMPPSGPGWSDQSSFGVKPRDRRVAGRVAEQRAVVHARRPHDAAGVEQRRSDRTRPSPPRTRARCAAPNIASLNSLRDDAVAVLAGMASPCIRAPGRSIPRRSRASWRRRPGPSCSAPGARAGSRPRRARTRCPWSRAGRTRRSAARCSRRGRRGRRRSPR